MSASRWVRVVAVIEAVSYLGLLGASVAKRAYDMPGLVPVFGPVHGVIFLVYLMLVLAVRSDLGWDAVKTVIALGAAFIPFGTLLVERQLARRSEATVTPASANRPPTADVPTG
jgi:integral membrane protein